jgi:acetylornithine aminotransferase
MLDEEQSGVGRTGKWFVFQHTSVQPDVMTLAKGLGSGYPIGACLAVGAASKVFKPGGHGSTFGGNPLACTAALTTLSVIEEEKLLSNALETGTIIRNGLKQGLQGIEDVVEVRGQGMMIGIELVSPCTQLVERALHKGLLINVTADTVIRLLPPLIMRKNEAELLTLSLLELIKEFLKQGR